MKKYFTNKQWSEVIEKVKLTITNITFKTKAQFIYNKKEIEQVLEKLYDDLGSKFDKLKDRHKSAGTLKKINYFFFDVYKIKEIRGSSYIPTPETYSNPKCGLINIQNDDQECFKWCMKYHQTNRSKHSDRLSVLKK